MNKYKKGQNIMKKRLRLIKMKSKIMKNIKITYNNKNENKLL